VGKPLPSGSITSPRPAEGFTPWPQGRRGARGEPPQAPNERCPRLAFLSRRPDGLPACKMGLEGIISKRLGSRYRSGRKPDWLKFKNTEAPCGEAGGGGGLGR
jgi:hypothetical protein